MAFDRNDAADLLALKTEVNTDPIGMGYDPAGNTTQLLKLLNDPASNVGGDMVAGDITPRIMLRDVIDPGDLTPGGQFEQGELEFVKMVMEISQLPDDDLSEMRTKLEAVFPANTTTGAAFRALSRAISRAEALFGVDTVISRDDWFAARDS